MILIFFLKKFYSLNTELLGSSLALCTDQEESYAVALNITRDVANAKLAAITDQPL